MPVTVNENKKLCLSVPYKSHVQIGFNHRVLKCKAVCDLIANRGMAVDQIATTSWQWIDHESFEGLKHRMRIVVSIDPACTLSAVEFHQFIAVGMVLSQTSLDGFIGVLWIHLQSCLDVLRHWWIVEKVVLVATLRVGRL